MSTPNQLKAQYGLSAGWRYRSGALHAAWDVRCPTGTPLHSPVAGVVADCRDGVQNNRPGHNPGSGAPSNWVLIHHKGHTFYFQHLSPGLAVRKGQSVKVGTLLGKTGNTGNSTGPHLHYVHQRGLRHAGDRYNYLKNNGATSIWEPTTEEAGSMPFTNKELDQIAKVVEKVAGAAVWKQKINDPLGNNGAGEKVAAQGLLGRIRRKQGK